MNFFSEQHISKEDVSVNAFEKGVEFIIKERSFRGEIGSPCRPQFDRYVRTRCDASPMHFKKVNGRAVEFARVQDATFCTDRFGFLSVALSSTKGVSRLAEIYFSFHNGTIGSKDLQSPKLGFTQQCSVLTALLKQSVATPKELAAICTLFGKRKSDLSDILSVFRKSDLLHNVDKENFAKELSRYQAVACAGAPSLLSKFGDKFPCKESCCVTSPDAFQFLPWPALQGAPIGYSFGTCRLEKQGLYFYNDRNGKNIKIMEPIWVNQVLHGEGKELGAREVICHDAHGFQKNLSIGEEDLDSPRVFAILRSHGVHVPISKTEQGGIREYLVNQFPVKEATRIAANSSGWQQDGSHIGPNGDNPASGSFYRVKALALPSEDYVNPDSIDLFSSTTDRFVLLAILASLAGAAIKPLHRRGVCIHFHGNTDEARKALLLSASSAWDGRTYSFNEAKKHVRDLKRQYSDSTLCVGGAHPK